MIKKEEKEKIISHARPNYIMSIYSMKCPRCRRGSMFTYRNSWNLKKALAMPDKCPVCSQPYELEVGFYYGTGYVSYALSIAYLAATFIAWFVLIGMSVNDNRFFWWMGLSVSSLILLQPWVMRLSRVVYLNFFVKYDPDYKTNPVKKFD